MRKQTKIAAIVSAAALLAIGASMASFAATGWVEEAEGWRYYDRDGYAETEVWRSSGGQWFWLDEDGYMATNRLLDNADDNGNTYYVGPTGARVTNQWVAITDEDANYYYYDEENDAGYNWYYFQASGKAYKTTGTTSFKLIDGKYYAFDGDGCMLYGWVDGESHRCTDSETAYVDGIYYCGDITDGARVTNDWRKLYVGGDRPNSDSADEDLWFYFGANGKKVQGDAGSYKTKSISGKNYVFDENGIMQTEWYDALTTDTKTKPFAYYGDEADGARRSGWYKRIPSQYVHESAYNDGTEKWFYALNNGTLVTSQIKTISGKKYAFNEYGEMMSGLWALQINPTTNGIINKVEFNAEGMVNDIEDYVPTGYDVYYFGGGDDGAMKVSNQNVTVDGVTTQFTFGRSGATYGKGLNGLQNRVFYTYGKRVKADSDYRYQVVEVVKHNNGEYEVVDKPFAATAAASEPDTEWQYPYDGNHYWFLVSTSGGQMQGSKYTDAEGRVYELNKNHEVVKCYWKN